VHLGHRGTPPRFSAIERHAAPRLFTKDVFPGESEFRNALSRPPYPRTAACDRPELRRHARIHLFRSFPSCSPMSQIQYWRARHRNSTRAAWGLQQNVMVDLRRADRTLSPQAMPLHCPGAKRSGAAAPWPLERSSGVALTVGPCACWSRPPPARTLSRYWRACHRNSDEFLWVVYGARSLPT
jgi:hypothetical protein